MSCPICHRNDHHDCRHGNQQPSKKGSRNQPGRPVPASRNSRRGRGQGFTLIELLLVCTVIAIVAVMAIPSLQTARKHANETSAISSLRTMTSAQIQYRTRFGAYGQVGDLTTVGFIDDTFVDGEKSGYRFSTNGAPGIATWAVVAQPVSPGVSGDRWFSVDESGVIRFEQGVMPTPASPPVD